MVQHDVTFASKMSKSGKRIKNRRKMTLLCVPVRLNGVTLFDHEKTRSDH